MRDLLHNLRTAGVMVTIAADDPDTLDLDGSESVLTSGLLDRVRAHKAELLAALRAAQQTTPGLPPDAPAGLHALVDDVLRAFGGTVIRVRNPRQHLADLIHESRRHGDTNRALNLREHWRERAAIREYDGGQRRDAAEAAALTEVIQQWHDAA